LATPIAAALLNSFMAQVYPWVPSGSVAESDEPTKVPGRRGVWYRLGQHGVKTERSRGRRHRRPAQFRLRTDRPGHPVAQGNRARHPCGGGQCSLLGPSEILSLLGVGGRFVPLPLQAWACTWPPVGPGRGMARTCTSVWGWSCGGNRSCGPSVGPASGVRWAMALDERGLHQVPNVAPRPVPNGPAAHIGARDLPSSPVGGVAAPCGTDVSLRVR
jgi:hypothetical protein